MCREHTDWKKLLEYAEGGAPIDSSVSDHLAACSECRERMEQARAFLCILGDAHLECVPETLLQRTLELLGVSGHSVSEEMENETAGTLKNRMLSAASALTEVLAVLVADSRIPSPALRGTAAAEPCLLRYRCAAYEITLSVPQRSAGGPFAIIGQVAPLQADSLEPGGWVDLPGSSGRLRADLTDFGEFRLETEEAAVTEVLIRIGNDLVRVPLPSDLG